MSTEEDNFKMATRNEQQKYYSSIETKFYSNKVNSNQKTRIENVREMERQNENTANAPLCFVNGANAPLCFLNGANAPPSPAYERRTY